MTEQWRPVVGWEGFYEVSDLGRVRSVDRVVTAGPRGGSRPIRGKVLRTPRGSFGYLQITMGAPGRPKKARTVHSLVAEAFLGPRPEGMEVCHNNGDPGDARLSNLRYDTISENRLDIVRHGRHAFVNRTHCPQGHPYDEANTDQRPTGRRCRTCHRNRERGRKQRRQEAVA